jgi:hypothetical protein
MPKPKIPDAPPVPSKEADAAKARVAAEQQAINQSQGRQATILTSPLGVPGDQTNRRRTQITGF